MNNTGARASQFYHRFCQFTDHKLTGIAQINRSCHRCISRHQTDKTFDQVIHIAEGTGLGAVTVNRNVLALQRLNNKIGNHTSVVRSHIRTESIENPDDFYFCVIGFVKVEKQGFRTALSLIIAGARAERIDIAPIGFNLRMNMRVAVNL